MEVLAWQAESGLIYANGGIETKPGSLVSKYTNGGCVQLVRQDDYGQMETNLAKFVTTDGRDGDAFFIIMGDALPYVSLALDKLIPGQYEAIGVIGFSDGEDQCMLPAEVAKDPTKARGTLVAAVPEDGDWNVCVKYASDNGVKVNADPKVFDQDAMNFVDTTSFTDADAKLVSHYCEQRKLVKNGRDTGDTVTACVNGVATWTPGDVDVVQHYDGRSKNIDGEWVNYGIVGVASTHDYAGQMPALIIGSKKWNAQHADVIVGLLKAADRGAAAINSGDNDALQQLGVLNAKVFKEQTPDYWIKYFRGTTGFDRLGNQTRLGGSRVIGLRQQADYLGVRSGAFNVFKAVYDTFSGYDRTFRPDLSPKVIPYSDIVNTTYLEQALQGIQLNTGVTNASFGQHLATTTRVVSNRVWAIEFDTGRATIRPESFRVLNQVAAQAGMTGLHIRVKGFTDTTGSADVNTLLSRQRAEAVAEFLNQISDADFPMTRFDVKGYGPANPVATNATAEGRQQNRRVEIEFYQ